MRKQIRRPWLVAVDAAQFRDNARIGLTVPIDLYSDHDQAFVRTPGGRLGYLPRRETKELRTAFPQWTSSHGGDVVMSFPASILDVRDEYHEGGPAVRLEYTLPEPVKTPGFPWAEFGVAAASVAVVLSAAWLAVRWWLRGW